MQVMETMERVLGRSILPRWSVCTILFFTWKEQGQRAKALALLEECVRLQSLILGVNHHLTMSSSTALNEWKIEELQIGAFKSEDTEK